MRRVGRTKRWGDPMSYSDRYIASMLLRHPNKSICVRCFNQAKDEGSIEHDPGCPAGRKR